ncbi:hypothetical protein EG68_07634 [Paragonimus skrjabini miyazakii]|uniref:Uncharacterized protein n=1 Tax=Paragonimus skrjabini miyazakii TaxID=59628 RepID=A0A8S9YRP5_9TREM|nr:hypothetical protein EG68_07634 [Paragonimus skrjabini miyazakii]
MSNLYKLPKIIFFGDSLTERGWSYDGGWLAMVADSLVRLRPTGVLDLSPCFTFSWTTLQKELEITLDRILLISLPPVDEARYNAVQLAKEIPPVRQLKCCQIYAQACKENWHEFFSDGLHFSRKGSEFLANILNFIFNEQLADCTVQLPDWKTMNMEDPQSTLQAYRDGFKNHH